MVGLRLRVGEVIAAAEMHAHGGGASDLGRNVERLGIGRAIEGKFPPDNVLDIGEVLLALPVSIQVDIAGRLEDTWIEVEVPLDDDSSFEEALPFGQRGIESLPGDYKGGRRSPLSCPLVAVRSSAIMPAWAAGLVAMRSTTASSI